MRKTTVNMLSVGCLFFFLLFSQLSCSQQSSLKTVEIQVIDIPPQDGVLLIEGPESKDFIAVDLTILNEPCDPENVILGMELRNRTIQPVEVYVAHSPIYT